ncbi:hypothetical protein [Paenibacillus sacheonensis]|uniref:Thioredoxin domain-containing protein n=1 Tax=Paenibacillus sacheonensis TaxID=742054 RepID=A0A7X4YPH7_9BACL|nr:hypothetical protein [Paenibacillus sacheonensis]MBM7565056.1 hypothetical protein [Paenibacillus sacheonensis]NBC70160.1 hypothetical protein [Paenibacillus sacheonensis]
MKLKMLVLIVVSMITVSLVSGCGGPTKEEVLNELKPAETQNYAIHLFYENNLPDSEATAVNVFHNSNPAYTKAIVKVQFWDHEQDRNKKWAAAIGVKAFPMYVIVDADGIVLKTPFLSRVKEFLEQSILTT